MHCLGEVGWPPAGSTGPEDHGQGSSRLRKGVAVRGDHVITDAPVHGPGIGMQASSAQRGEQRQEVLVAGLSLHRIRMLLAVVEEGFRVPRFQLLRDPVGEAPPSCWIERGTTGTSAAGKR